MKLASSVAATFCCALLAVPANAETCEQRFPGSCRLEVSTAIVKTKGDPAVSAPRSSRRAKRARKPVAKRVRVAAAIVAVPLPRPAPARISAVASARPTAIVDEAFNTLAVDDSSDAALEEALINRRDRMLGFALQ